MAAASKFPLNEVLRNLRVFAKEHPRDAAVVSFIVSLGLRQVLYHLFLESKNESKEREYVSYRQMSFTKTKGGTVNLSMVAGTSESMNEHSLDCLTWNSFLQLLSFGFQQLFGSSSHTK